MSIREDLELDLRPALSAVDRLDRALEQVASAFKTGLSRALEALSGVVVRDVDARQVTSAIDAAVQTADTAVEATAEASEVTGSIDAAVDAADTAVEVTGEAAQVTGAVDAAVDAADTGVEVTGEAGQVTGSIDAAVQAANTHVTVTADTSGLDRAVQATGELSDGLGGAAAGAGALAGGWGTWGIVKGAGVALGGAAIVDFGRDAIEAASAAEEAANKVQQVFGDSGQAVELFAQDAAVNLGLSSRAALEAAGTFGNLFVALELPQGEAAALSEDVLQLAADLGSFNDVDPTEVLERLRSGLVGEIEPLRRLGVNFNAAQVEAKAFELGLTDASGAVSEAAKVQARWALILEQTVPAQGDFARTSDSLANAQRTLAGLFGDVQERLGDELLPVMKSFVTITADSLLPILETVGGPLASLSATVLDSLTPGFVGLADAIEPLGAPLGELAEAVGGVVVALAPLLTTVIEGFGAAAEVVGPLISLLARLLEVLTPLIGVLADVTAVVLEWTNPFSLATKALDLFGFGASDAEQRAERLGEALFGAAEGAGEVAAALTDADGALSAYLETESRFESRHQIDDLARLGTSYEELGRQLRDGEEGLRDFTREAIEAGEVQGRLTKAGYELTGGNRDLIRSFEKEQAALEDVAREQLDQLVLRGEITAAARDEAVAVAGATSETGGYVVALEAVLEHQGALGAQTPVLSESLRGQATTWDELARAIVAGEVATDDYTLAAAALGTEIGNVESFAETIGQAIDEFASTAASQLPSVADALEGIEEATDPLTIIANLQEQQDTIQTYVFNVGVLLDQGYTEAARIALEKGPVIGGTLAKELVAATPEVRAQFEEQAAATRETLTAAEVYIREVATPGLIGAEGDLARAATQAYAYNLNLDAATTYGLGLAAQVLAENRAVDEQASARGRDVGRTFTEGISAGMALALEGLLATVSATVDAAYLEARRASRSRSPSLLFAGLGEDWMAGLASGIDRSSTMVDDSIGRVVATAATTPTVTPPIPNVGDTYGDVNIGPITVNVPEGMTAGQARTLGREIGRGAAAEISRAGLIRTQIRAL